MSSQFDEPDRAILRTLVRTVARSFYDHPQIILLDQLIKKDAIRDDGLAAMVGTTIKDMNKVAGPLVYARLIHTMTRPEHREGPIMPHARPVNKTYYWIDYKDFCDVVRWRMDALYRSLDTKLRTENENKGYVCTHCQKAYLALDVDKLFTPDGFMCDACGSEVVDFVEQALESGAGGDDKMASFNSQTAWIQEGLRKTAEIVFPHFDIKLWLAANTTQGEADASATAVRVDVLVSGDDERKAKELERLAAEQRSANVLPEWHLTSTISGQQTALGISHAAHLAKTSGSFVESNDDDRGVIDERHISGLDDYYAQQEAEQTAAATPSAILSPIAKAEATSSDSEGESNLPAPPRSTIATSTASTPSSLSSGLGLKRPWTGSDSPLLPGIPLPTLTPANTTAAPSPALSSASSSALYVPASSVLPSATASPVPPPSPNLGDSALVSEESGPQSKPVSVAGVMKPFADVTDEDQEAMTPDEYTAYYEIWEVVNL